MAILVMVPGSHLLADIDLSATAASDYVERGITQTNHGPALHAGIRYRNDTGWYAGAFASRVDYVRSSDKRSTQFDYVLGLHRRTSMNFAVDLAFVWYAFDDDQPINYNWREWQLGLHIRDRWSVVMAASRDWYGLGGKSYTGELTYRQALPGLLVLDATLGNNRIRGRFGGDYTYLDTGIALPIGNVATRLGYVAVDSNARAFRRSAVSRWVLSVTWSGTM